MENSEILLNRALEALKSVNISTDYWAVGGGPDWIGIIVYQFDANRINPIYGASTTVQPKSYTVLYIMKIK